MAARKRTKKPREFWVAVFEDDLNGTDRCTELAVHKTRKEAEEYAVHLHHEISCEEYYPRVFVGKVELTHEVVPPSLAFYTVKPL